MAYFRKYETVIESHGVEAISDIEKTVAAMRAVGIPIRNFCGSQAFAAA
jgi:hypothetical protein